MNGAYPTASELRVKRSRYRPTTADLLLSKYRVEPSGCWRWLGGITTTGYGHQSICKRYYQAHRLLYILLVAPVPDGLELDHLCRRRWCVNPAHLEVVSHAENSQRGRSTRLTAAQVASIRRAREGGAGVRALARMFDVSPATVSLIANGHRWRAGRRLLPSHTGDLPNDGSAA